MRNTPEGRAFLRLVTERITEKRKTRPVSHSLSEIARRCRMSPPALSLILRGKREPSFYVAIRLANYLKIDLSLVQKELGGLHDPLTTGYEPVLS